MQKHKEDTYKPSFKQLFAREAEKAKAYNAAKKQQDRTCGACKEAKPPTEFYPSDKYVCKECRKQMRRDNYQKNKHKNKEKTPGNSKETLTQLRNEVAMLRDLVSLLIEHAPQEVQAQAIRIASNATPIYDGEHGDSGEESVETDPLAEVGALYNKRHLLKEELKTFDTDDDQRDVIQSYHNYIEKEYRRLKKAYESTHDKIPRHVLNEYLNSALLQDVIKEAFAQDF